jgi:hypothetical protein
MRGMLSNQQLVRTPNQTLSGTTPNNSQAVDSRGFDALTAYLETGAVTVAGVAGFTLKLQHSDTLVGTDFADVPAGQVSSTLTVTSDTDDTIIAGGTGISYTGPKRYLRGVFTGTTNTNAVVHIMWVLGKPHRAPCAPIGTPLATS